MSKQCPCHMLARRRQTVLCRIKQIAGADHHETPRDDHGTQSAQHFALAF